MTAASVAEYFFNDGAQIETDTLFVFGSPHHQAHFAARIHELWRAHGLRHIVVSGHRGEAQSIAGAAQQLGVPSDLFILETEAGNTLENVLFSAPLLRALPGRSAYLLCKIHAAPRCLLTFRQVLPDWTASARIVNHFEVEASGWRLHRVFVQKAAAELRKIALYSARGDIAAPDSAESIPALLAELEDYQR